MDEAPNPDTSVPVHALVSDGTGGESRDAYPDEVIWQLPVGFFRLSASYEVILVNPALARMLGYDGPEQTAPQPAEGLIDGWEALRDEADGAAWGQRPVTRRKGMLIARDGAKLHVLVSIWKRRAGEGAGYVFEGLVEDNTESVRAQSELSTSEAQLRMIAENMHDLVNQTDQEGRILYMSPSHRKVLGYGPEDMLGTSLLDYIHVDDLDHVLDAIANAIAYGSKGPVEFRILHKDGHYVWVEGIGNPLKGEDGHLLGAVFSGHDISARKKAEEGAKLANKKIALISDITRHDIMNAMMVLHGNLTLAEARTGEERTRAALRKSLTASRSILEQIRFYNDYLRLGSVEPRWISLVRAFDSGVEGIDMRGIGLEKSFDGFEILADPCLPKVFHNLVENSCTHGRCTTTVRASAFEADEVLRIVLEDDGKGVPEEMKPHLFEWRLGQRTGHGLNYISEVLRITGSSISEEGTAGMGARFVICVPKGMYRSASGPEPRPLP